MVPNMTAVYGDGEDGGELILADLIKFKRYSIVIQAFNEVGNGPLSEPTTAQTMEGGTEKYYNLSTREHVFKCEIVVLVPSSYPLEVHCSPLGSQTLQMSWKHPEIQYWNGVIQGFVVTYDSIDRG